MITEATTLPLTLSQRALLAELSAAETNAGKQKNAAILAIVAGSLDLADVTSSCAVALTDAGITVTPKG